MSIATALSSVAHAVLVMVRPGVWEAIFGAPTLLCCSSLTYRERISFSSGGVEAAVSIIVCNSTVIIPAVLRALGVGDPFMREDTVDPRFSTGIDIAPMTPAEVELDFPTSRGTRTTGSTEFEAVSTLLSRQQQHSIDLDVKDDPKHRLAAQISGGSLEDSKSTNVILSIERSSITDSFCLSVAKKVRDIEADAGEG